MKKVSLFILASIFCFTSIAQETLRTIKGKVTDGELPLENANVVVKKDTTASYTNAEGNYSIKAKVGQVLVYTYPGMKPLELIVEDVTAILNITMFPEVEYLDEVVVKQKRADTQRELEMDYVENKGVIKTLFGALDEKKVNFTLRVLDAENLNKGTFYIHDALLGLVPGLRIYNDKDNPSIKRAYLRGFQPSAGDPSAVYEVDGMLFENIDWLSISEIYRVGVILPGIGTQKYGLRATGGVIVINTKDMVNNLVGKTNKRAWEKNNYFGKLYSDKELRKNWPNYLQTLYNAESIEQAAEVYEAGKKMNNSNPYFFIDAHHYFLTEWQSSNMANRTIEDGQILERENAELLKALAYSKDVNGFVEESNNLYEKTLKLRPSYGQSYRDLANSYRANEKYTKSANLYLRYNHILELGMLATDSTKFKELMDTEMYNLLNLTELKGLSKDVVSGVAKDNPVGTRLVFEWNTSNAEFELEFRGKEENLSHVWKHTMADNPEMIKEEQRTGYSSVDYVFDSNIDSSLNVNINYLGNKQLSPTYMKVTVYRNYGRPDQTSKSKVHRLQVKNVPQQLLVLNDI